MTIQVCRICLAHNIRLYPIADTSLQSFYEKITNKSFKVGDGSISAVSHMYCYICFHLLKKCHRFSEIAKKADKMIEKISENGIQITEQYLSMIHKPYLYMAFKNSPTTNLNLPLYVSKNVEGSDVKHEGNEDTVNVIGTENTQQGLDSDPKKNPEDINTPTMLEPKKEIVQNIDEPDENESYTAETLDSQDLHHSSDLDDNVALDSFKFEEDNDSIGNEIIPEEDQGKKDTNKQFHEVLLTVEEQIQRMQKKKKSPTYIRMPFKCEICCIGFANLRTFAVHMKKHDERSGAFACGVCLVRCRSTAQLHAHASAHAQREYACGKCAHRQPTIAQVKKHYKLEHGASQNRSDGLSDRSAASGPKKRKLDQTGEIYEDQTTTKEKENHNKKGVPGPRTRRLVTEENSTKKKTETLSNNDKNAKRTDVERKRHLNKRVHCKKLYRTRNKVSVQKKPLRGSKLFKRQDDTTTTGKRSFVCNYCEKNFTYKCKLITHIRIHTGEKPFKCNYCSKQFARKEKLKTHLKVHTGEKPFSCNHCGKKFTQNMYLTTHLMIHNDVRPFSCHSCGKKFTTKGYLVSHMKWHNGKKRFTCDYCEKSFVLKDILKRHLKTHTGEKPFACSYCETKFATKSHIKRHLQVHEKPHACTYCDKTFINEDRLATHVSKHTGKRPFSCKNCEKEFLKKWDLIQHMRKHTGEKPFACNICGNMFSRRKSLMLHVRRHTSEKMYLCNYCGKKFTEKGNLTSHIRIHTGEKPFKCNHCDKKFAEKSSLTKHLALNHTVEKKCEHCDYKTERNKDFINHARKHTGQKLFECNYCGAVFLRKGHLVIHIRLHTNTEQFECNYCDKLFTRLSRLKEHIRIHTGENMFKCHCCEKKFPRKPDLTKHLRMHTRVMRTDKNHTKMS